MTPWQDSGYAYRIVKDIINADIYRASKTKAERDIVVAPAHVVAWKKLRAVGLEPNYGRVNQLSVVSVPHLCRIVKANCNNRTGMKCIWIFRR
jgi:hypothetical protein